MNLKSGESMEIIYRGNHLNLNRQELLDLLKKMVSPRRYQHILGVERATIELAKLYDYRDFEKASIAALLHDLCKEIPAEEMQALAVKFDGRIDLERANAAILHGPAASQYAKDELGLIDQEVLLAVSQHSIGALEMSLLSQILFVADYIEAGRDFKGVKKARKLARENLQAAVIYKMKSTIQHLAKQKAYIYLPSVIHYNHWVTKEKEII